jgi:hypothetical protein
MNQQEWERDIINRQRNIVFPDTVLNEGRFYRNIASGRAVYTRGQKASLLLVVVFFTFVHAVSFAADLSDFLSYDHGNLQRWVFWPSFYSLLWLLFWIFLAVKGLFPAHKPPKHRRGYLRSSNF